MAARRTNDKEDRVAEPRKESEDYEDSGESVNCEACSGSCAMCKY